ncbi:uncharacterized protein LAJ45_06956 [Morchella importuna]|uniref:uncharacterized protein n=1 Tax=Morchella importuna TaxID=1174673 RepID=UPI001E8EA03B|nr:uncharacterized protein LAJ45_06956 [Morchella importuna]KAH8148981.1 hypothetical protein LAJ45_06956 [Morchella importuna]
MTDTNITHETQQTLNNTQGQAGAQTTNPAAGAASAAAAGAQGVRRNPMMERFLDQTPNEESAASTAVLNLRSAQGAP